MTTNAFIPAGFEDSDDEDYDYFDYDINYNNDRQQLNSDNNVKLNDNNTNSLQTFSQNYHLLVNQNENKTLSPKLKRNTIIRSTRSPSPGSLVLDDIRLGVINGNLDYFKSQIECENNFFIDTILKAGWTALMFAANNGHKDIVHYCLERGADPNYHKDDFTPLMAVCSSINQNEDDLISCAQYLIKFGANVNSCDRNGNSSLIYAAKSGKSGIISELVENSAQINRANKDGWTALHWAVREGHGKVIERLINLNIDISLKTSSLKTAADIALTKGHEKINDILEKVKQRISGDINGVESNGTQNRRLSLEESHILDTYVKPINTVDVQQKNKPIKRNPDELENFLRLSNVIDLLPLFEDNYISYQDLVTDTEEVLEKIGIKELSVKKKILSNIILLHKQEWKKESLRDLNLDTNITCPDIVCILANIANHMSRIDETIVFLRHIIHKKPEILNYDNDISTVSKVRDETLQTLINTRCLYQELQFLRNELSPIEDISEPQTRDVLSIPYELEEDINNNKKSPPNRSISLIVLSVGVLSVLALKYGNITKGNLIHFITKSIPGPNITKFNSILLTM